MEQGCNDPGNFSGQDGRHSIANLMKLLRSVTLKEIIVRERLQSRRLPDGEASALSRVGMNEVMSIL